MGPTAPACFPGALSYVAGATHSWSTAELDGANGDGRGVNGVSRFKPPNVVSV